MKWVKASERLPDGGIGMKHWRYADDKSPCSIGLVFMNINRGTPEMVEWLDESGEGDAVDVATIRQALSDYIRTEGCSCCQDVEGHKQAANRLGELLKVDKYEDGSGYNFYAYQSNK